MIGTVAAFHRAPQVIDRIELGRVGRQQLERQARMLGHEGRDGLAAVRAQPIPDDDHGPFEVTKDVAQAVDEVLASGRAVKQPQIGAHAPAPGRERHQADGRQMIAAQPVADDGRVCDRRPRAHDGRCQREARLVLEDERGARAPGFFLMRGASSRCQRAISSSSRWLARRIGFCQERPS